MSTCLFKTARTASTGQVPRLLASQAAKISSSLFEQSPQQRQERHCQAIPDCQLEEMKSTLIRRALSANHRHRLGPPFTAQNEISDASPSLSINAIPPSGPPQCQSRSLSAEKVCRAGHGCPTTRKTLRERHCDKKDTTKTRKTLPSHS
jgi:hypothetical protein